jgi:hypothetical protein
VGFLYRLDFASGKRYVGITAQTAGQRMAGHRRRAKDGRALAVYRAWRRYGEPRMIVLARANGAFLLMLEERAVRAYGTYGHGGYNMIPGGAANTACATETRLKIAAKAKGRRPSLATREKMSASRMGNTNAAGTVWTAEMRNAVSTRLLGIPRSAEVRAKIAEGITGQCRSLETRARISVARRAIFETKKGLTPCGPSS